MSGRTIWRSGDPFRTTMVIGKNMIKIHLNAAEAPPVFAKGSMGRAVGTNTTSFELEVFLEDSATQKVVRATLPGVEVGKLERFEHGKSWA